MATFHCQRCALLGKESSQHPRPVGRHCRLNVIAPTTRSLEQLTQGDQADQETLRKHDSSTMLALILEKIEALEKDKRRLEKKIAEQRTPGMPVAHSSPNRDHSCTRQCSQDLDPDDSDSLLPDAQFLKENQLIQVQVQEQLRQLKGKHRDTGRKILNPDY